MEQAGARGVATAKIRGFGRSVYLPYRVHLHAITVAQELAEVRRIIRDKCPPLPGVYGVVDGGGELVYVGMSATLQDRLITYFQGGSALRKEQCIAKYADRFVWEVAGHELTAQLRELELIRRHQPRFNVKGRQPVRPPGFIYLSREDAPRFRVARRLPKAVRHSWGPLPITWRIREAVEIVNRLFKLCDCAPSVQMRFADQAYLFALDLRLQCLRGEIGTCLGPCAGKCTTSEYAVQIRSARAFLDGHDRAVLDQLEQRLNDAAELQQYERAALLRDTLERIRFLWGQLEILREPPLPEQFVYQLQLGRRYVWYLIAAGRVVAATPQPSSYVSARGCERLLARVFRDDELTRPDVDRPAVQIVSSWFRAHPAELQTILSPADALRICHGLMAKQTRSI
jgi:excinuclease ABC subunit C